MTLIYEGRGKWWRYDDKPVYEGDLDENLPTGEWITPGEWVPDENSWSFDYDGSGFYRDSYFVATGDPYWEQNAEQKLNELKNADNKESNRINKINKVLNAFDDEVGPIINQTQNLQHDYLTAKQLILNKKKVLTDGGISNKDADEIVNQLIGPTGQFRDYYSIYKFPNGPTWDPSVLPGMLSSTVKQRNDLGSKFNKYIDDRNGYYINETPQGQAASKAWDEAVAADDLDTILRYGSKEAFAKNDYIKQITDPTRSAADIQNIRGSQASSLSPLVTDYREKVFPDAQKQQILDKVQNDIFGLVTAKTPGATGYEFKDVQQGLSDLVSKDKTINKLWNEAKSEVLFKEATKGTLGPWTKLTKSLGVKDSMLTDQESFGTLLSRVATLNTIDPTDKKIIEDNNALFKAVAELKNNAEFKDLTSYSPEINAAFTASVQASEAEQIRKFGEMRQEILQDTIDQLKIAKQKENSLSLFRSSYVGQEISALQQDFKSVIGDIGGGGILPLGSSQKEFNKKLDTGLADIFGTRNGLIYNWEDWFNTEIEKKYAGDIDIPNDYVAPKFRTLSAGFVDKATVDSWKKYDDAYKILKTNPNDFFAKNTVVNVPIDYVPVEKRKTVNEKWINYETQLKAAGYVDAPTLASWAKYDDEYKKTNVIPQNAPTDYIVPERRMNQDVQFAKDFFTKYLKPRFDASQDITEFQDYIDVVKNTQNPFQTQDRLNALKLAAQTSVSKWFADLQKAGDSRFNADYYFDPNGYLKTNGVGDPNNPLLPGAAFTDSDYALTDASINLQKQSEEVKAAWEAAKNGGTSLDSDGNTINWLLEAYNYGADINDKEAFARLHYQLVGLKNPEAFDPAPDVYAPQIAQRYITKVLTPYLIDKANKIGSVFGEFIKPSDYVEEVLKAVNLKENKEQWAKLLENNGLDPNASLNELKNTLVDALTQDSTINIKTRIDALIKEGKTPTQTELGVEYLQKGPATGKETPASGAYAVFKNAGYAGSEEDFYSTFLPDASQEDIDILNAAYAPAGQISSLLPTVSGTGIERISSMAQLFGDSSISEVLGTAGISIPSSKPSFLGGLLLSSEDDVGIGDPFEDTSTPFTTVSGTTKKKDQIGIGDPFDTIGITDPFAEDSDPFSSDNPFASIGSTSSVSTPTIKTNVNVFTQGFSSKKNSSMGSLFDSFGGSFGF